MRRKSSSILHDYSGTRLHDDMSSIQGASKWALDGTTVVAFLVLNASLK